MPHVDLRLPATAAITPWPILNGQGAMRRHRLARRTLDVWLAATLLILLGPLMAVIALCIRLDSPGPVLFRQVRTGFRGAPFVIIKFRTMRSRASSQAPGAWGDVSFEQRLRLIQVAQDDRDITRIGRLLRASRLDEAPQLLNVLKGDMALVGPRPHMPELDALFRDALPDIEHRYSVRPGLTGLAQARGLVGATPDVASMAARLASDLVYVERQSLWLDLTILARTTLLICGLAPWRRRPRRQPAGRDGALWPERLPLYPSRRTPAT